MEANNVVSINLNTRLIETKGYCEQASSNELHIVVFGQVSLDDKAISVDELLAYFEKNTSIEQSYHALSGAFSIVYLDKKSNQVSLLNDILSVQQCYYAEVDEQLLVSPSLKALKQLSSKPFKISNQAIFNYIYFHCIPSPSTIYESVFKLEPGKLVTWSSAGEKGTQTLYSPYFATDSEQSAQLKTECLDTIEQAVANSTSEHCGAFLSGGLDSSTVAGMLAKYSKPAKTFSIGFEAKGYDETEYAQITSKHFGTEHEVLYLQPEEAADKFVEVAQYFDEPFGNSSAMAAYFCALFAKQHGVTTLLAGDGGDELFAGNSRYAKQKIFEVWSGLPQFARSGLKPLAQITSGIPVAKKLSSYIRQAEVPLPERLQSYNFVHLLGLDNMFESDFIASVDPSLPEQQLRSRYKDCRSDDPIDCMLYLDWKFTLADNDLVKVNKMCELAGVTVKYPLLDKSVVDFSCRVPAKDKLPGQNLRDFYKKACQGFLADETLSKSKHGFGLPFGVWLKENKQLNQLSIDALNAFKQRGIVKHSLIEQALSAHQSEHADYYGELIWIIVVLELWLQKEEQV